MPRWRQVVDEETGHSTFVPVDESARRFEGSAIHGDIQDFVSPIDGSVITDRKQIREHCRKHNVVPAAEFSNEFYARKRKEREDHANGRFSKHETLERKQQIYESWVRSEREA